jgi:hypothetical protein
MPYVIGIVLSVSVALFARSVGFDRDRAFYPTVLMVIASYDVLFAAITESVHTVFVVENSGVPVWWPASCLAHDLGAGGSLAWLIKRHPRMFHERQ